MKIKDLLQEGGIRLDGKAETKEEALNAAVELMAAGGNILDKEVYRKGVYDREAEGTTGIGEGIAIPHCKSAAVNRPALCAMVFPGGVEFDSLDGKPVELMFLIAAPESKDNVHLDVLSRLSVLLMDETVTARLKTAADPAEFLRILDQAEKEKEEKEKKAGKKESNGRRGPDGIARTGGEPKKGTPEADMQGKKILAVTACPTGIAHTYMAAEALEKKAAKLGIQIKVETRGSGGTKNELTRGEIEQADCIIVAADTQVPMDRFDGKRLILCKVADGIGKAEQLLARAAGGDAPVFHGNGSNAAESGKEDGDSVGHRIYKHLMNGVSHMLPFVVGGGILIAVAFLIDSLQIDLNEVSDEVRSNFGSITPTAAAVKRIGDIAFSFMLPVLAGFIALSVADRPGLALGFVGGYIAAQGKSGFLGALAAGFLAGYLIVLLRKLLSVLPKSMDGLKTVLLYPLLGILLIGLIMNYAVEPLVGMINTALNDGLSGMGGVSSVLLGIVLAGMMSVDMGGPVNKAAYVFGNASIAAGNYNIMAAVMIGGMVPPCAIALATLMFRQKFTAEERKAGPTNFIMGLSFITEGAIPFAAADPLRVIPACVIGSGLAGAISMAAGCELMAPHGGVFVFPVVEHAMLYLAALAAGTIVGALLLGLFKKSKSPSLANR